MTTTDAPSKFRYEGNGVTDTFAFTGRIFAAEDLVVEIITRATDVLVDTLTLTTDYSVTINGPSSASVVVTAPNIPSSLQDIQVRRALDKTQSLVLPTGTVFPAKSVENALDKVTAMVQELQEEVDRKVGIPVTDSGEVPDLTEILDGAVEAQEAAEAAQAAAETAGTNAEAAEALAESWAIDPIGDRPEGSAKYWAEQAEDFAASADVGDISALPSGTIAAADEIPFADVNDSDAIKKATVQGILDLVPAPDPAGWVPIKTVVAANDTSINFVNGAAGVVLDSTYKAYVVVITDLVPATDDSAVWFRTSSNAGSSYDTGASDYDYTALQQDSAAASYGQSSTGDTKIKLTDTGTGHGVGSGAAEGFNAVLVLYNPAGTRATSIYAEMSYINAGGTTTYGSVGGARLAAADVDAIRFLMSTGNITSGVFTLYGIAGA
jgi:hypothetical protein